MSTPEPIHRCEVCGYHVPREPDDLQLGPHCEMCAKSMEPLPWSKPRIERAPRMWPAVKWPMTEDGELIRD